MYKVTVIKPFEHLNIKYNYENEVFVEIANYGHCVEIVMSKDNRNSICEVNSTFFKEHFAKKYKSNNQEIYMSSRNKNEYPVYLNKEQLDAIPILVNMAMIYTWELYKKTQDDKFYEQHKENIDLIQEYHNKGYQGILAVGSIIESKCKYALDNINIEEAVAPFLNKYDKEYNQESLDIEKAIEHLKLTNERFKQVSCTNCIHWDNLFNSMDNKNLITPRPCCTCFPYDPKDSVKKIKRPHYEESK